MNSKESLTLCPDKGSLLPFLNLETYIVPKGHRKDSFSEKETEAVKRERDLRMKEKKKGATMNWGCWSFRYVQAVGFVLWALSAFSVFSCLSSSKTPESQRFASTVTAPLFHTSLFSILVIYKQAGLKQKQNPEENKSLTQTTKKRTSRIMPCLCGSPRLVTPWMKCNQHLQHLKSSIIKV